MSQERPDSSVRGRGPGRFSSARRLRLPPGERVGAAGVDGYHLDLRAKADPDAAIVAEQLPQGAGHVSVAQAGLGYYERYLAGEGEEHLERALVLGRHLRSLLRRDPGPHFGGLEHDYRYRYGAVLEPGWLSAMAQGEASSLFVRLAAATGDDAFAQAAVDALAPLEVPLERGGVLGTLDGRPFPEEYPTTPQSHVLNGAVFALWGVHDVGVALDLAEWRARFSDGVETLARSIGQWDLGYWSRYDLFPHRPLVNVASSFYHVLHADQLDALARLTADPRLAGAAASFRRQYAARANRARAFVEKAAFRLLVPRQGAEPARG